MKGMKGCSSFRIWSRAQAVVARVSALAAFVGAVQQRLGEFEIPVAEHVTDEMIGGAGRIVEAQGFDRRGDIGGRLRRLGHDPLIDGLRHRRRIETRHA